ncbi:hypothetical protein AD929_01425 [Gluconobacter potus]|uniref:Uncharacterized protein n=1 Tax=Gluconobacter potus TaxID=2724927 RepID=A0A149QZZ5_9PROT|nr:hypothetical protein [Gluconobacter potus]KXV02896.1 hypothetical protein AD929_01425 [Gluconobacter potus]
MASGEDMLCGAILLEQIQRLLKMSSGLAGCSVGGGDRIPVEFIQIFRASKAIVPEPIASGVKKPGGPGRPETAATTFARTRLRAWFEYEGDGFPHRGDQKKCEDYILDELAKNGLELSLTRVRTVVKEESAKLAAKKASEKLKAEKEKDRKSADNSKGQ